MRLSESWGVLWKVFIFAHYRQGEERRGITLEALAVSDYRVVFRCRYTYEYPAVAIAALQELPTSCRLPNVWEGIVAIARQCSA